jgi:hypothetical protein
MDEYLVDIWTSEGKDTIKTYGSSIIDVVNSMVDLHHIEDIGEIRRLNDYESWKFSNKISLKELRDLKALVKDKAQIKFEISKEST